MRGELRQIHLASALTVEGLLFSLTLEIQARPLQKQPECGPSLSGSPNVSFLSLGMDDDFLEFLTDKIADRLNHEEYRDLSKSVCGLIV